MAREKGMGSLQREKSGRYTARVSVDGTRYARSTRTDDRTRAEAFLSRMMLAPLGLGARAVPLTDVWREYEKSPSRREQAASTMNAKRLVWLAFAAWIEANHGEITQMRQLSEEVVQEYLRVFRLRHCASTYNNHVCVLREVCRVVADTECGGRRAEGGGRGDPWARVRLLPDDTHSRRAFTAAELERIVAAAARAGGEWPLLVKAGVYTGLRLGDCCRLAWEEVDLGRGVIQLVPRKTRKFGTMVTIPLHPALREALERVRRAEGGGRSAEGGVSSAEGGVSSAEGGVRRAGPVMPQMAAWYLDEHWRVDEGLKAVFAAAGIRTSVVLEGRRQATPDATFHSFRHTFVSFAVHAGVPLPVVQSIVGHTSAAMTRHYYHENEAALRRAVEAMPTVGGSGARGRAEGEVRRAECRVRSAEGGSVPPQVASACGERLTPAQRLKRLESYFRRGLITEEERRTQRAAIVGTL